MKLIIQELAEEDFNNLEDHLLDLILDGKVSEFKYKGVAPGTMYIAVDIIEDASKIICELDSEEYQIMIITRYYEVYVTIPKDHCSHVIIQ